MKQMKVLTYLRHLLLPFFLFYLVAVSSAVRENKKLREIYSWTELEFEFPSESAREYAIRFGKFIPGSPMPIDIDVYAAPNKSSVMFMTIPRSRKGVPVTLGYVTNKKTSGGNPIIAPYPNWAWQNPGGDCSGITSVYRIQIDSCDRMWVLDTGRILERQVCPPQLLAFSLKDNNKLLSRHVFPRDQYSDNSLFVTPSVDVRHTYGHCTDTHVYIADVGGYALIVYDDGSKRSWKISNNLFYPYPQYGTFTINKESFDLMDGILGLALGPIQPDGDRNLFFHSLTSRVEAWVPTSIIRNRDTFSSNSEASPRSFREFTNERSSQSAAQVMDKNGVMFFGLLSDTAIACWNNKNFPQYAMKNIEKVVVDRETLQFPSGMKIVTLPGMSPMLWVITIRLQKVMTGSLTTKETNFRIQAGFVDELIRDTKCKAV